MTSEAKDKENESGMSKKDKAFLMKALWKALQSPAWTKDELIAFGWAIFSKKTLSQMPEKTFENIYPLLNSITESLGDQLSKEADAVAASAAQPSEKTDENNDQSAAENPK